MFGDKFNIGNIASLMKNAGKIKEMMTEAQAKLAKIEVTGESGAGAAQIQFNAQGYALKTMIDPDILKEDKTILEELITAAINDGVKKIEKEKEALLGNAGSILGGTIDS